MTEPTKTPATLAEALVDLTVEQELAVVAALQTGLRTVAHPAAAPRTDDEIEADLDNMPV